MRGLFGRGCVGLLLGFEMRGIGMEMVWNWQGMREVANNCNLVAFWPFGYS